MHTVGQTVQCDGNFTLLRYIRALSARDLERSVGFEQGRLDTGFSVVALADDELLAAADFELKASSRWSAGVIGRHAATPGQQLEILLSARGQDIAALKEKVSRFFALRGGNTPAKVLPNARHTAAMRYPDAEALGPGIRSGVPQFNLPQPRRWVVVRTG